MLLWTFNRPIRAIGVILANGPHVYKPGDFSAICDVCHGYTTIAFANANGWKCKACAAKRARTPGVEVVKKRVTWGVFDNLNQLVAEFNYSQKNEAEAYAAKLTIEKKSTHFIQPIKRQSTQ